MSYNGLNMLQWTGQDWSGRIIYSKCKIIFMKWRRYGLLWYHNHRIFLLCAILWRHKLPALVVVICLVEPTICLVETWHLLQKSIKSMASLVCIVPHMLEEVKFMNSYIVVLEHLIITFSYRRWNQQN